MKKFGFSVLIGNLRKYTFCLQEIDAEIRSEKAICYKHMTRKFEADKVFIETEKFIFLLDGVILNKRALLCKGQNWLDAIIQLYREKGECFFEEFRGSYAGLLYDKREDKFILFSDHVGSKFLYYSLVDGALICSTMIAHIYSFLKENQINYQLSTESAYLLLSYGYMLENRTLCDRIYKLRPGCYLVFQQGQLREKRFCFLDNEPDFSLTEDEAIELLDVEFRRAVAAQFDKDLEYGYKHAVALSAGLDSRMTTWVAHEMGYSNQLNYTFSQSDYWDEVIPKQIARDLKHEWMFKMLDHGLWMLDIEEITQLTGGNVVYYGLAHGNSLFKFLCFDELGMAHSGQLGDVVFGTFFLSLNNNQQFQWGDGAYSKSYLDKVCSINLSEYKNQEIANFYQRGFNGANNGLLAIMQYTETFSPFMDWELMNAVLKIPLKYRYGHNIYKKWILTKYPHAANYVWEKIGATIREPMIKIRGKSIPIRQLLKKILMKWFSLKSGWMTSNHMNPIGYYWQNNDVLRKQIKQILALNGLVEDKELRGVLQQICREGTIMEKVQAVSLLKAVEVFFGSTFKSEK